MGEYLDYFKAKIIYVWGILHNLAYTSKFFFKPKKFLACQIFDVSIHWTKCKIGKTMVIFL